MAISTIAIKTLDACNNSKNDTVNGGVLMEVVIWWQRWLVKGNVSNRDSDKFQAVREKCF